MNLSKHIKLVIMAWVGFMFLIALRSNAPADVQFVEDYISFTQVADLPLRNLPEKQAWQKAAPEVVEISIPRQGNESGQPALWYNSGSDGKKPLLLALHSWSDSYLQHYGIPYGVFAVKNDWIFMHPDFRGRFDNADATGSEKAVRDVLQALEYAKANAEVDESRIYLAGFSGGAMMSLIMVGRYPDKFTAALASVPVYDLNDWYDYLEEAQLFYADRYQRDIEASCGGNPTVSDQAREECRKRSPSTYLSQARGTEVQVYVGGGMGDPFVPPSHAIRAFNELADEEDRISEEDFMYIDENKALPEHLQGQEVSDPFFEKAGLPVVLKRKSNNATIVLFDGGHDIVYNQGLDWLSKQQR
ncbi:Prolyl oligopeptidase family protein [Desulfonatronum thiosulfatophilum]|uniref:Prolyl oligopeptidase family protein n=1 Tax=Desulfonatronum thiosulfatophilum TaxID=617002 RepID=A0A1G6ETK9_9BACT|nr:prolyl oligopeptidase family serine peptidase [Desulfonatronum thiosulfatophilum]SDB60756.1 Prolyl oligopeptidase family protein [Desulfonatronum thiosulfatophilum]